LGFSPASQSGVPTNIPSLTERADMNKLIIGVDVAKEWVDIAIAGKPGVTRIANSSEAIAAWLAGVDAAKVGLVAFEPTGGHERCLRRILVGAKVAFARVHPNRITAFRQQCGIKAKTDCIDAGLIADFAAEELTRRGSVPLVEGDETLRELAARRRQLKALLHAERCRRELAANVVVSHSLTVAITALEQALVEVEAATAKHIKESDRLAEVSRRMQTLTGVGPVTAMTMLADLPELGRLSGKQIAALCGLAPHNRDSGKRRGHAGIGHGRPSVRMVLFNGARAAIRFNPVMKAFYDHLNRDNRRPGKVALTAVMRKMLVTLNAMIRDGTDWKHAAAAAI
jgi:transposase